LPDTSTIIVGLISAAIIFYVRSSMIHAQKQKIAAIRLQGYLFYWQNFVIDNDLFSLFYYGVKWDEELKNIYKSGGKIEDAVKLEEEKKNIISEIKNKIENGEIADNKSEISKILAKFPSITGETLLELAKITKQNLIEGKIFINDTEAASLGSAVSLQSIELKMHLISILDVVTMILVTALNNPKEFKINEYGKELSQCAWKGIVASKNISSLTKISNTVASMSIMHLTIKNIFNEL